MDQGHVLHGSHPPGQGKAGLWCSCALWTASPICWPRTPAGQGVPAGMGTLSPSHSPALEPDADPAITRTAPVLGGLHVATQSQSEGSQGKLLVSVL